MVYIAVESDGYDFSLNMGYFTDKAKAEKYCELQDRLDDSYSHYVTEVKCLDDFDTNSKVVPYYSFYIGKELDEDFNEAISYDYYEIKEWLIENDYINEAELQKVEDNDKSLNQVGNKAHRECGEYIKNNISNDVMSELLEYVNRPEMRWNNDDEPVNRIYDGNLSIYEDENMVEVFSVNSFEEAKKEALRLYADWKNK